MQSMTIEELRAIHSAGGVAGVTLKGQDGGFLVQIATMSGVFAVLTKARSDEPRRFGNPLAALKTLIGLGITHGAFDASEWCPGENRSGNPGRVEAMRQAHQAAAYVKWLAAEIEEAVDDPRPNLSHEDVMSEWPDSGA